MVNFKTTKEELSIIVKIAERSVEIAKEHSIKYDYMTAIMDIDACHCNGCPLDLNKLLSADLFNFSHDVFGIRKNINRDNGILENFFLPRCARNDK